MLALKRDAYGALIYAHYRGLPSVEIIERDDGWLGVSTGAPSYWPSNGPPQPASGTDVVPIFNSVWNEFLIRCSQPARRPPQAKVGPERQDVGGQRQGPSSESIDLYRDES
jgi:hypothetical protein